MGVTRPDVSPWGAPMLFMEKNDERKAIIVEYALSRKERLNAIRIAEELARELEKLEIEVQVPGGNKEKLYKITFQSELMEEIKKCQEEVMNQGLDSLTGKEICTQRDNKDQPAMTVPKEKSEYTTKDISSIAKDAKVRHLLHSAIDNVMSNRVINCNTVKEIWDALETRCQGTDAIKKNRTHSREYDLEDINLKFLLALPECEDLKVTTIRDNYALDETTLDEIYGMLKTHELEMDQRSKRHGRKSRTFAVKDEEESLKVVVSKKGKGKALITKSDTESSSSDSDKDSETESLFEMDADEEMMKLGALMVKGITKIAYRKFRKGRKFSKKSGSSDKKGFRKSEGKARKSNRGDYSNVKCYNCGEKCHISPDCKKGKGDKGKTNKPKVNPVKFIGKTVKSDSEKMKDTKTEVKAESTSDKLKQNKPIEVNIGLMTKKHLKYKLKEIKNLNKGNRKNILVLDSGCSRHMTGNKALLSDFVEKAGPRVSYGDGNMGKTLGYVNINLGNVIIEKVALVLRLKHNLLSVSQICDRGYHVDFFEEHYEFVSKSTRKVVLKGYMHGNIYEAKLSTSSDGSAICLLSRASIEESWDWHKKLSHLNFNNINELVKKDLVRGLPKSLFAPDGLCDSCQKAKQRKSSFKSKTESSILEPYHLLHIDLFGPVNIMSIVKKKYAMVIVDEFTRYIWVYFLHTKSETASILIDHVKQLDKLVKESVKIIRSDNSTEFKNLIMEEFCKDHRIMQEFSAPGTPQQNGVVERKNRTLIEANATLINKYGKTPYEMVKKKKPNLKYFHIFGCKCFVLKTHLEQLSQFDLKADKGIFVGYPLSTKAIRVYNLRTKVVMESINVSFDDKKITGLEDFNDHDQLRFENEVSNSDSVNSDSLNPDTANSDGLNSDVIETVVTTSKENAPVQGGILKIQLHLKKHQNLKQVLQVLICQVLMGQVLIILETQILKNPTHRA
ncbi:hypothetical protein AgCh_013216 [Apium graveolens]